MWFYDDSQSKGTQAAADFPEDDYQDSAGFADPVGNFVLGLAVVFALAVLGFGMFIYPELLMRRFM